MTDGAIRGSLRIANSEPASTASGAMGYAGRLGTSLGFPVSSAQSFASFLIRMQTLASTGAAALREGKKQEPAESEHGNRPGRATTTPTAANGAVKSLSGQSENPSSSVYPPARKAQWTSGTTGESENSQAEAPMRAGPTMKTHGPSQFGEAEPETRISHRQDPSTNPTPIAGVAPVSLPAPALSAANLETADPGSDSAERASQLCNGLNSTRSFETGPLQTGSIRAYEGGSRTTLPRSVAPENPSRPGLPFDGFEETTTLEQDNEREDSPARIPSHDPLAALHSHASDPLASSPARESSSAPLQDSQASGASNVQQSIPRGPRLDPAMGAVPSPASREGHHTQTVERDHPTTASSVKGRGTGGVSFATGSVPGAGTIATAPHPGSLQDSHRAIVPMKTAQTLDGADAFKSLDMEGEHPSVRWVHSSAQQAEAGFDDPALGWVSVRADAGSAGVHPALIPSSAEAAQVLAGHLAGLNSFLANRAPGVGDVVLASPESGSLETGTQAGSGQGSREQQRQDAARDTTSPTTLDAEANHRSGSSTSLPRGESSLAVGAPAATLEQSRAAYISVMV